MKKNVLSGILGTLMPMSGYASGYIRPTNSYLVSQATPLRSNTLVKQSLASSPQPRPAATAEKLDIQAGQVVNELVIIDAAVPDKHLLYKNIRPGVDVVEIDGNRDGLGQLKQILNRYHDLAAVHLVSHASDGVILLGNQRIDEAVLEQDLSLFNKLNGAIRQGGDLLFYGCDLAATSKGEAFLEVISGHTHVDVTASNNPTGSRVKHGDWHLEIQTGDIETTPMFDSAAMRDFSHLLNFTGTLTLNQMPTGYANHKSYVVSGTSYTFNVKSAGSGNQDLYNYSPGYVYISTGSSSQTQSYVYFSGNETFDLSSIYVYQGYGAPTKTIRITSDKGGIQDYAGGASGTIINFSGSQWTGIKKFTIQYADSTTMHWVKIDDIAIANLTSAQVNATPTNISLSATSINQASTGTNVTVGSLSTTDADSGDTHTYSLVSNGASANGSCGDSGDDNNASFNINGSNLRTASSLSVGSYNVCVQTNDGTTTFQKTFAVTVNQATSATTTAAAFNTTTGTNLSPSFNFGSNDETLTLAAAAHTAGSTANGGTGNDTLVAIDGADLSQLAALTGFETLTIPANATVAMSSSQHQSFTTFTDNINQTIQLVSGSDNVTGNVNIDSYELGASYSGTFTLGSGAQSVGGGSGNDTVNISGLTVTGTLAGNAGSNTLILGASADISGATISGFENFTQAGGATTMVAASQLAQFTGTVTATGSQTINVNGDGDFTTPIGIETISVNDSSTNTRTITVAAADTSVSAISATDAITFDIGSLTYTGTLTGDNTVSDTLHLANGANISAATISNITNLTLESNASVTMTGDQHTAFTGTVIAAGIETITVNGDGNLTTFADVENYVIGDSSTNTRQITLNPARTDTNVTVNSALDGNNVPNENITFVVQGNVFNGHLSAINSQSATVNLTLADTNLVGTQFTNISGLNLADNISVTLDSNIANAVPSFSGSNNTLQLSGGGTFDFTSSSFNGINRIELKDNNGFNLNLPSTLGTPSIDIGKFNGVTITQDVTIDASLVNGSLNMTAQNFSGANTFIGGSNNDTLHAGTGIDTMTGNLGSDSFVGSAAQLNGDTITDVSAGDRIVISGVTGLSQANVRFNGSSILEIDTNATTFAAPEVSLTLSNAAGGSLGFSVSSSGADTVLTAVQLPTVSSSNISISGASGTNGAYRVGDTVTVTWNNSGSGDNNAGVSGVTVDFSAFGGPSDVIATDMGGGQWTATYQLTNSVTNGSNLNVAITASNSGGSSSTTDNSNATVDSTPPSGHSVSFDDNTINAVESSTQSFTFAGAEVGSNYNYTISSSGGGTAVTGGGTLASATDQITGLNLSGLADGTLTLSVVVTDGAGNSAVAVTSTAVLDVTPPSGHSVTFDSNSYSASPISFTFAGAEVGAGYRYSISSSGGGTAVIGNGTIFTANMQVFGLDVSGLGNGTLTLSAVLTDTAGNAAIATTATTALALTPTNTAPTLTATATNPSYTAGNATPATLFVGAAVSTQDTNQTINSLTLTVSNVDSSAEEFIVADGTAIQLIAGNGSTVNNSLSYLVTVNNAIATVTLTGAISADSAQILVNGLAYRYNSALAADAQRVVTLTTIVDSGADNNSSSLAIASAANVMLGNRAPEISGSPSNAAQEGVSYSFTPTASDADGDQLTFSITNLPSWASFDSNTGTLSGTPSLSAAGDYNNIVISVSDGELSASLSAFSITVVNTNQPPVISGTPTTSITVGQPYRFVATASDPDADTRLTFSISSLPSWLSFNATTGELSGIAADAHVGQYNNISISVSDGIARASLPPFNISVQAGLDTDGDTVSDYQEGLDGTNPNDPEDYLDTESPQLRAPDTVLLDATALFTPITLRQLLGVNANTTDDVMQAALNSLASDNIDGDNCCSPAVVGMNNGLLHLKPGRNEVVWQAADRKGNQANAMQIVNIRPLVSFSKSQTVAEGSDVEFNILLNGKSPFYPLEVPFIIDEGASSASVEDHTLVNGSVIFEQDQTNATIRFSTIQDNNLEGDETLVVLLDDHTSDAEDLPQGNNADINDINAGVPARFTATIVEGNLPPRVTLTLAQGGVNTIKITPTNGDVTVTATASDANVGDNVTLDWSNNSSLINLSDDPTRFVFSPAALTSGSYNVNVVASDEQNASTTATFRFVVVSSLPTLSSGVDSDADGIDDATEGMADSDNDGIPDYLDNIEAANVLPEVARRTNSFLLECEPGISCRLGELAIQTDSGGALLSPEEMNRFSTLSDDVGYTSSGLFDFEMAELPNTGQSVAIVVPQLVSLPSQAVYRKFSNGSWRNFVEDSNNTLSSAAGSEGFCPPPGDESWQSGLTAGHWCVQLTIEDGGPNDADGEANGSIADPGGVAVANSNGDNGGDGGSEPIIPRKPHGGALSFAWLIWLTLFGIIRLRGKKPQR
ncbi:DUF4347 domain-containing protein [Shewanella sp.]|uniref:DUF4347 domain-containing protein n=1 Tax=Shewanella sp. TaxID=50422 RepID=UPI003A986BC3